MDVYGDKLPPNLQEPRNPLELLLWVIASGIYAARIIQSPEVYENSTQRRCLLLVGVQMAEQGRKELSGFAKSGIE
jgi:hypothetical protein